MRISCVSLIVLLSQVHENNAFSLVQQKVSTKSLSLRQGKKNTHQRRKFPTTKLFSSTLEMPTVTTKTIEKEDNSGIVLNDEEVAPPAPKSYLDDGFVFGLEGSGLERKKGRAANVVVEGDTLETQPYQVGIVTGTFLCHALLIAASLQTIFSTVNLASPSSILMTLLQVSVCFIGSWWSADLGSGVLHWSVDNYGNGRTPVMGNLIAAFQGHHSAPWTITQRGFCNNVYKLCTPFGAAPIVLVLATQSFRSLPFATIFLIGFSIWEILSQEFHKWSHMPPKKCPWWVNSILQTSGLAIGRGPHALHHTAPYEGNYCIVSGLNNKWLDNCGFFRVLEHIVYSLNGVESNAWKLDPKLRERTLQGHYQRPRK